MPLQSTSQSGCSQRVKELGVKKRMWGAERLSGTLSHCEGLGLRRTDGWDLQVQAEPNNCPTEKNIPTPGQRSARLGCDGGIFILYGFYGIFQE